MIQIDDAGWGSPIGGVLIAGYRPETDAFAVAEIAVEHFQPPRFQERTYLDAAVDATRRDGATLARCTRSVQRIEDAPSFAALASPADEPVETLALAGEGATVARCLWRRITLAPAQNRRCSAGEDAPSASARVCSGFVHGHTHAWLATSGRPWQIVKVEGRLQELIETALAEYLRGLGFEPPKSTEQYGALFYQAIKWLKDGNLNRAGMNAERLRVAKTGWASFPFYRDYPYVQAKELARRAKSRKGLARLRGEEFA